MSIKVYSIPNCGTCRKAIQWLGGATYEFINTKEQPPAWLKPQGSRTGGFPTITEYLWPVNPAWQQQTPEEHRSNLFQVEVKEILKTLGKVNETSKGIESTEVH